MTWKDHEPFATFRAEPTRFAIGLPVVFVGGAVAGVLLLPTNFSLAMAAQLVLQTAGFLALYVPALRRRREGGE